MFNLINFNTMKKVFLFLVLALACTVGMTSCGDDDKSVPLTGITVAPKTIKLPVGGLQKVTVTAVPANATDVTYTWTSQNTNVATVDAIGLVTITGVGSTTVTVNGGTVSETISVEGLINSLTITDADGNTTGTYPYNGSPITFTLTATTVPAGAAVTPTWTSSSSTVTVVAGSNGLSAEVTIAGDGNAVITATVGDVTATYAISTTSVFESAVGYWRFEDASNLGKATKGEDLRYEPEWVQVVAGPSATKKAVYVKENPDPSLSHNYGDCPDVKDEYGFYWDHQLAGTIPVTDEAVGNAIPQFTILIDARVPVEPDNYHYPFYVTMHEKIFHYGCDLRPSSGNLVVCSNWATRGTLVPEMLPGQEPWVRVVIKCDQATLAEGFHWAADWGRGDLSVYSNGQKVFEETRVNNVGFLAIYEGFPIKFLGGMPTGQNFNYSVSTIAFWDRLLTDEEIASLGGVSK
jgi:hypothetical protein